LTIKYCDINNAYPLIKLKGDSYYKNQQLENNGQ